jgi:hypothetical protein
VNVSGVASVEINDPDFADPHQSPDSRLGGVGVGFAETLPP